MCHPTKTSDNIEIDALDEVDLETEWDASELNENEFLYDRKTGGGSFRQYATEDIPARLLIENSSATEREKRALLKVVADRRKEILATRRRAQRCEKLLRAAALEDACVQLYAAGVPTKDIAARLGVVAPFVSNRVGRAKKLYRRLLGDNAAAAAERYASAATQVREIAAGIDPFSKAVGKRGEPLITRLGAVVAEELVKVRRGQVKATCDENGRLQTMAAKTKGGEILVIDLDAFEKFIDAVCPDDGEE